MKKQDNTAIRNEYAKVWQNDERMINYCVGEVSQVVTLSGGRMVVIEKPGIKKDFCFGYSTDHSGHEAADAMRSANAASKSATYFRERNTRELTGKIATFSEKPTGGKFYLQQQYETRCNANIWAVTFIRPCDAWKIAGLNVVELTESDRRALYAAYREELQKLNKRLDAYLKRYGLSKVRTWTYWADR